MSSSINQSMSLFIAYVFPNISIQRIINIFEDANLGIVKHVDFIKKVDKKGKSFNNIYVHFDRWFESEQAQQFQDSIRDPEARTTLQYDEPWFWIVLENTYKKTEKQQQEQEEQEEQEEQQDQPQIKKRRIDLEQLYRSLPQLNRKPTLNIKEQKTTSISPLFKQQSYNFWNQPTTNQESRLLEKILQLQEEIKEIKRKMA